MAIIFNWHQYALINIGIAVCYFIFKAILHLPIIKNNLSQIQQLHLVRYALLFVILLFLLLPMALQIFVVSHAAPFQFHPMLKHAADIWLTHSLPNVTAIPLEESVSLPPLTWWITTMLSFGMACLIGRYFFNLYRLWQMPRSSLFQKKFNQLHLCYTENISTPFCWSTFKTHYIFIPTNLLNHQQHLKLALRHELQHLRQGDTYWLHILAIVKICFFCNPCVYWWRKWINDLQEFACDESLISNHPTSRIAYAQCLVDIARHISIVPTITPNIIALCKEDYSILTRRVTMIFNQSSIKRSKLTLLTAYTAYALTTSTLAFAIVGNQAITHMSEKDLTTMVQHEKLDITITPEVVAEINHILSNPAAKATIKTALQNMNRYKTYIAGELNKNDMPTELLALPLIESGYRPLPESENPTKAAGIWQFIPATAKSYGLTISKKRDDRLNTELETQAAINYLKALYAQFNDWKLAVIAYEIGERNTDELIKATGAQDPWDLIRLAHDIHIINTKALSKFFASYEAATILINNPSLLA